MNPPEKRLGLWAWRRKWHLARVYTSADRDDPDGLRRVARALNCRAFLSVSDDPAVEGRVFAFDTSEEREAFLCSIHSQSMCFWCGPIPKAPGLRTENHMNHVVDLPAVEMVF